MNSARRSFLRSLGLIGAGAAAGRRAHAGQHAHEAPKKPTIQPTTTLGDNVPFQTPDLGKLPWKMVDGVKEFHLLAEPVKREFVPGSTFDVWGFNGSMPGPTIEAVEGERVRIIFDNHLPEPTSMHWHGLEVPIEMDGVPGVTQDLVPPGGRFVYEFTLHQKGTFFYHSHMAMQEMLGMIGFFILHPKEEYRPKIDKDFGLILQEWAILPNNTVPNTLSMEFNWLTLNGKSGPATTPLLVRLGERVRIRMINMGMDHHPIHLHGHQFVVTGTEGGRVPEAAWTPQNTVIVGVAQARDIEFEAIYPGDWMFHCHLPHHMMNHMVSMVGPMSHLGHGMHSGMGMEEGMGMLKRGNALSEENGPSLGRSLGVGATYEQATTHLTSGSRQSMQHAGHSMAGREMKRVPGYPQDHFMPVDDQVAIPENYGLRPGWSGGVMGMMNLVRVLKLEMYDKVMEMVRQGRKEQPSKEPMKHIHGGEE